MKPELRQQYQGRETTPQQLRIQAQRDLWNACITENIGILFGGRIIGAIIAALFFFA